MVRRAKDTESYMAGNTQEIPVARFKNKGNTNCWSRSPRFFST